MTRQRKYHVLAITLLLAGVAAGAACWALNGTAFWVTCGLAMVLVIAGIYVAGHASTEPGDREEQRTQKL